MRLRHWDIRLRDLQSGHVRSEQVLSVSMVLYKKRGSAVYLVSTFPRACSSYSQNKPKVVIICAETRGAISDNEIILLYLIVE